MARPLRLEYPGAIYRVVAHGNERRPVFRLVEEDHAHARRLAEAVAAMDGYLVDLATVETNMTYITTPGRDARDVVAALAEHEVDVVALGPELLRVVTHLHIGDAEIDQAIAAFHLPLLRRSELRLDDLVPQSLVVAFPVVVLAELTNPHQSCSSSGSGMWVKLMRMGAASRLSCTLPK